MKNIRLVFSILFISFLTACASGYNAINPQRLNYLSTDKSENVSLEYKYDLLDNKYAKKEAKKNVRLVALKVTNKSNKDLIFGKDVKLAYENDSEVFIMENKKVFSELKQGSAIYLLYLLLTPMNFFTETTNGNNVETNSVPVGLVLGPGIAGGNIIASSTANSKFKAELNKYDIMGKTIKKGDTIYGIIGIRSDGYDALKLKIE